MLVTYRRFIGEAMATLIIKLNLENTFSRLSSSLYTSLIDYLY